MLPDVGESDVSGIGFTLVSERVFEREVAAPASQPADRPDGQIGEVGVPTKGLGCVDVGPARLEERDAHRRERLTQREPAEGEDRRIDEDRSKSLLLRRL
jgi:hypothetical protein